MRLKLLSQHRSAHYVVALSFALCSLGAAAQPALACFPPPVDDCGKGVVTGTTNGVEWGAWWIERDFEWQRSHWYRMPGAVITKPDPGTDSIAAYAVRLWAANIGTAANSCWKNPPKEAIPACNAMVKASDATRPPPIIYNVDRATRSDGTRPGYRLVSVLGGTELAVALLPSTLTADGTRHKAGAWCECWRGAVKSSMTQYCLVTQTASYAVCKRQ